MSVLDQFTCSYLTPAVFTARAFKAFDSLSGYAVRGRTGKGTKQLIEEVIPLAVFLRSLEIPQRQVRGRYFPGSQQFDAKLRIRGIEVDHGLLKPSYFIEITSAVSPNDHLKREALNLNGFAYSGDDIIRTGSRSTKNVMITSRAAALNPGESITKAAQWIRDALRKKSQINYRTPCILVVRVEPDHYPSISDWASLAKIVRNDVDRTRFEKTYVVHVWTNTVFTV